MKSSDVTGVNIWNLRMPNAMRDFCEKKSNIGRWIYVIQERYMHTIVVDCIYIYWDSVVHGESWARVCVAKWNQGIPVGYGLWEGGGCHAWLVALQQAIRRKRRHTGPISHPSSCLAAPALPITEVLAALAPCPLRVARCLDCCSALLEMLRTPWVAIVQLQCSKWVHSRDNVADWRCYRICTCRRTFLKLLRPL
jgi:hypothetical protein